MSLWGDMMRRSSGEIIRKENYITGKEQLRDYVKRALEEKDHKSELENFADILDELKKGVDKSLDGILKTNSKRIKLLDDEKAKLFQIEDDKHLLSDLELLVLQVCLMLPFKLLSYVSLEDFLIKGGVRVVVKKGRPKNDILSIPRELEEARRFWEKMVNDNPEDHIAKKMLEKINNDISVWRQSSILGRYLPSEKIIELYPENMKDDNSEVKPYLLVSILAHEVMHAYFDRYRSSSDDYSYEYSIEEPMAEFGMLLYLYETNQDYYYSLAEGNVCSKETAYRYGYALMMQHLKERVNLAPNDNETPTRLDLECYKCRLK